MNAGGLYPYQIPAAEGLLAALKLHGAAIDSSDCGVGKSYHAGAIIRELNLPTLVVCPKISVTAWGRVLEHLGTSADIQNYEMLSTGRLAYGSWEKPLPPAKDRKWEYVCESCQCRVDLVRTSRCPVRASGVHCVTPKRIPHDYGKFVWHEAIKLLVFDEVHKCGGLDSLNSQLLIAAKRQNITTLCLSATAVESPLGFKALGYVLGLHGGPSCFYNWARARGCSRPVFGGLHFLVSEERKKSIMSALHRDLFPSRGVRVRIADIPGFPECHVTAEIFDLDESGRLNELYAVMEDAIAELNEIKSTDKSAEHPLVRLLRASQEAELLKIPLYIALHDEAQEAGRSVAIFVCYRRSLDELRRRLKCGGIYGGQCPNERQQVIDNFQANKDTSVIVNIAAGGQAISLHDLWGRPRTGIVSPHPSAVKTRQVLGRLARAGGKSSARFRMPLVANSPEEKLHSRLVSKLNCIDMLNDGDLTAVNLPLTTRSLSECLEE